jgi:hypothetical protein
VTIAWVHIVEVLFLEHFNVLDSAAQASKRLLSTSTTAFLDYILTTMIRAHELSSMGNDLIYG